MSIVIIDPVSSGINYLSAAQDLGLNVYVCSTDEGQRRLSLDQRKKTHKVIEIDTNNFDLMFATLHRLGDISAVLPGVEYAVPMASRLGAALGTIHLNNFAVQLVRNKFKFRSRLTELGLSNIGFFLNYSGEAVQIPKGFRFPAVVKPVDMAGSINVSKVYNLEELTQVIEAFNRALPDDVGFTSNGNVIIEEYISGQEFSIEGVVCQDGRIKVVSITEKLLGSEPFFVEVGHIVGQHCDKASRSKMTNYAHAVLDAIQLNVGPFHLELRITPEGNPVAIELAARLPGDKIVELIKRSYGVDIAYETLCEYTGIENLTVPFEGNISAIAFIPRGDKKTFTKLLDLDQLIDHPYCLSHHVYFQPDDELGCEQDWSSRVGYIIFSGENESEVRKLVRLTNEEVKIA